MPQPKYQKPIQAALLTAIAQLSKLLVGFILLKLIAYHFGAVGLGVLGHFMSLVAILTMLAGGGITNGVIKYVAEYKSSPRNLVSFISASATYTLVFSILTLIAGVSLSKRISTFVFGNEHYYYIIVITAISQTAFAFTNIVTGVANGMGETKIYAKILIYGNVIGFPISYFLIKYNGIPGAAIGMVALIVSQAFPAYFFYKSSPLSKIRIYHRFKYSNYDKLFSFTLMLLTSALAFPVVEIIIRETLIRESGYTHAGIWQGAIKLSNAYLSFFSSFLAYYFMPLISAEKNKQIIKNHVKKNVLSIMIAFTFGALILYSNRSTLIPLLLSGDFGLLQDFIIYQLIGDFFKISAYVIGFVAVAKAATKIYIFAEVFQSILFVGISMLLTNQITPIKSVFIAYMLTYILYFILTSGVFLYWIRRKTSGHLIR